LCSPTRKRSPIPHQRFERAPLCGGPLPRSGKTPLRRKQLGLRPATRELPLGQDHCGPSDLLHPRNRLGVFEGPRRRLQCPTCLLERTLGVHRVFPSLEPAEPVLKPGGLRAGSRLVRSPRGACKSADEPDQNEARGARRTSLIDT
jgi:hypothetical protein